MKVNKIAIIGGGASGMTAAIAAARRGAAVTILEKNPRIGKKILSTGNGRCNYSNKNISEKSYEQTFCAYAVNRFTASDAVKFFKDIGMLSAEEDGRLYPKSMQASAVLDVLRAELERLKVSIVTDFDVIAVCFKDGGFEIKSADKRVFYADKAVIATGGCASPKTGSDGSGYGLLKKLGHSITNLHPALCRIKTDKGISGVRQYGKVYTSDGESRIGEIQFAKDALSGIPVFGLSGKVKKGDNIYLDLMPEMTENEVYEYLKTRCGDTLETYFIGILNKSLGQMFLKDCGFSPLSRSVQSLSDSDIRHIAKSMQKWKFTVTGTESWDNAQVTSGGVCLSEVDERTMQSRIIKGLYITGELLDVDADCGGYNLHWAWASGILAGNEAANV